MPGASPPRRPASVWAFRRAAPGSAGGAGGGAAFATVAAGRVMVAPRSRSEGGEAPAGAGGATLPFMGTLDPPGPCHGSSIGGARTTAPQDRHTRRTRGFARVGHTCPHVQVTSRCLATMASSATRVGITRWPRGCSPVGNLPGALGAGRLPTGRSAAAQRLPAVGADGPGMPTPAGGCPDRPGEDARPGDGRRQAVHELGNVGRHVEVNRSPPHGADRSRGWQRQAG